MLAHYKWVKLPLVLATVMALLSCGGAEERKTKYLERSKSYLEDKNYDKARIELKNVLQIDPKSAEAYFLLGEIEEKAGAMEKAFNAYSKAAELKPGYTQADIKIARMYVMAQQPDKAAEKVDAILKKNPGDLDAKLVRSVILSQKGSSKEALKLALEVAKADPASVEAVILVSALYKKNEDMGKAREVLEQGAIRSPKDVRLLAAMVQLYVEQKDTVRTEEVLRKIVAIEPDVMEHRTRLAAFLSNNKQPEPARQVLREAIKADPKDAKRYLILAELLVNQNQTSQAETELLAAIAANPEEFELRFGLARLYQKMNKSDQAEGVYRKIVEIDGIGPDGMTARTRLAAMLLDAGKAAETKTLIDEVLAENHQDTEALLIRGKMYMGGDKPDPQAAIADFRSVLKSQPDSVEVIGMLADAHQLNHEPDLARENLQRAVKVAPADATARVRLARFLRANDKDADGAMQVIDDFLSRSPDDMVALGEKLEIFGAQRNTQGISEVLARIKKAHPEKPAGYYMSGEFYVMQGKYQDALREFEQARAKSAKDFRVTGAISKVYRQLNEPENAIKVLDEYLSTSPGNMDALQMKAEVLASTNDLAGSRKVVDEIKRLYPDRAAGFYMSGELYLSQKDYEAARREYKLAAEKSPGDTRITQAIVKSYFAEKNPDGAVAWLAQVDKEKPGDGYVNFLMGEVLLSQKKYAESEQQLLKAMQLAPKRDDIYIRLADAHTLQNHADAAIKTLQDGLAVLPDSDNLRLKLGSTYETAGRFDDAISVYDAMVKKNPDNVVAANNLAALLADHKGDPESLERARKLALPFESSKQAALVDTLGWIYYRLNDFDHALPLLKKAVDAAPEAPVLRYHLGMAYYKKGDKAAAREQLTRAFATESQFYGADEGRAVLKELQ